MKRLTAFIMTAAICMSLCACETKIPDDSEIVDSMGVELPDGGKQYKISHYEFSVSEGMTYTGGDEFNCLFEKKLGSDDDIMFMVEEYPETLTTPKVYGEMLLPTYLNSGAYSDIQCQATTFGERDGYRIFGKATEEGKNYDFELLLISDGAGSMFSMSCYYPEDTAKHEEYRQERDHVLNSLNFVGEMPADAGKAEREYFTLNYTTDWFLVRNDIVTLCYKQADSACKRVTSLSVEALPDASGSPKELAEAYRQETEGSYRWYEDMEVFEDEILGRKCWAVSYGNANDSCGHATLCYRYFFEENGMVYRVILGFCPEEEKDTSDMVNKLKMDT